AVRAFGPKASKAIGLEFEANRECIRLGFAAALLCGSNLLGDAHKGLYMVTDLVCNYVGLGEFAWRAEAILEVLVESEVNVDILRQQAKYRRRAYPEEITCNQRHHNRAYANMPWPDAAAKAFAASVLDILAFALVF